MHAAHREPLQVRSQLATVHARPMRQHDLDSQARILHGVHRYFGLLYEGPLMSESAMISWRKSTFGGALPSVRLTVCGT